MFRIGTASKLHKKYCNSAATVIWLIFVNYHFRKYRKPIAITTYRQVFVSDRQLF